MWNSLATRRLVKDGQSRSALEFECCTVGSFDAERSFAVTSNVLSTTSYRSRTASKNRDVSTDFLDTSTSGGLVFELFLFVLLGWTIED